jgi:D-3-phosphoglycerate dehydrogenase
MCGDKPLSILRENGIEIVPNPYNRKLTPEEVLTLAADCDGIVAGVELLDERVLKNLPRLKCISRVGVGLESVDMKAAESLGILVRNTPDGPTRAVAELTIGMAFALLRRIPQADRNIRNGIWKKEMGSILLGKTAGIIGLGNIGKEVAGLFLALGCEVIANDPKPDLAWLEQYPVSMVKLDDLLAGSDLVCLHLSFTSKGKPLIGEEQLALMKPTAVLINLARGEVIDEDALYEALSNGRLAGAALDVFSAEPYKGRLIYLDNVVLTPHLGSYAREARLNMEIQAVENLLEGLSESTMDK